MAGLVSAVRAQERGAGVVVLEKGHRLGGTLPVTAGTIAVEPGADPVVDVVEPIEEGIAWLRNLGVTVREPDDRWLTEEAERKGRIDPPEFVDRMSEIVESGDGEILTSTPMKRLKVDDRDEIAGVVAHDEEFGTFEIDAPSVILATGGFSGNVDLLEQYLPSAEVWNGRHPWCTGEGFVAARAVGAKTTRGLSNALGWLRPAPPAQITEENRRSASTAYANEAILIDDEGRRFTDESEHVSGSTALVTEFLENVDGTGYLVLDGRLYESHTGQVAFSPRIGDLVEGARDAGAPVIEAGSLDDLGRELDAAGVDGRQAVLTIREFNEAVRGEADARLRPPRAENRAPVDEPPFYAVAVQPSVVYVRGGLDIDHEARVVSRERSTTGLRYTPTDVADVTVEPIPGLYAAGIEVGRPEDHGYYHLGLSLGLATGRVAGEHAAEHATKRRERTTG